MAMNPLAVANLMSQAAQQKSGQPNNAQPQGSNGPTNPKAKQVATAKEQEQAKGKKPSKKKAMPPQGGTGAPPMNGMPGA